MVTDSTPPAAGTQERREAMAAALWAANPHSGGVPWDSVAMRRYNGTSDVREMFLGFADAALASPAPSGQSVADMAAFGASDAACYLYPGEDQQPERAAFCEGAAHAVSAPSGQGVSGERERNLEAQRQTIEASARVADRMDGGLNIAGAIRRLLPNEALAAPAPSCAPGEVERAARAMCVADGLDPDEHIVGGQATGFEDFGPLWQAEERSEGQLGLTNYKRLAAAALSPQGLGAKEGGE